MSKARQIADLLADLDNVATSGQYADLAGNPTVVSLFTNDSGYITSAAVPTAVSELTNDSNFSTVAYVDTAVSDLVDSSPAALDTLNELATALDNDANFATTVTTSIATKATTTSVTAIDTRVIAIEAQYRATNEITATAGQTAFAINGLSAAPTDVECFMNGIRLASTDYTGAYSAGTYIVTLDEATVLADLIEIVAWKL